MIADEADKGLNPPSSFPYPKAQKMKVELDKKALFALASDSRMEILKALHPQRRTVAQLADQMGIDKAAVHRHLKKLEEGGLVTRYEDHGFVYYGLSWKARDVISPGENTKIVIVFSLSWLLIIGAVSAFLFGITSAYRAMNEAQTSTGEPAGGADRFFIGSSMSPEMLVLGIVLIVLAAALAYLGLRRLWKPKQRVSPEDGSSIAVHEDLAD